jgi:Flp pilus assembly protein TadD/predicted aspartyl protease
MRRSLRIFAVSALVTAASLILHADITRTPESAEVELQLGDLYFEKGIFLDAIDAYQHALEAPQFRRADQARSGLVRAALRAAEFDLARRQAEIRVKASPRDPGVLAQYADALWGAGRFDDAERTYRETLTLDPRHPRAIHGIARSLLSLNQLDAALDQAQSALRLTPDDAEIHSTLGAIYERMFRYDDATASYLRFVDLLPQKDTSFAAAWARAAIRFLYSFRGRKPYQMEPGADTQVYTLHFVLRNNKILIPAKINGRGTTELVVDTGAESTTISERTAEENHVNPITYTLTAGVGGVGLRGLQIARMDSLEIGSLKLRNVPCLIKSPRLRIPEPPPSDDTEAFSPLVLGFSMAIDYSAHTLTIGRHLPVEPADYELPLRMYGLATVRGTVGHDDYAGGFVVDTGGEVISISESAASAINPETKSRRQIPLKVYGMSGWDKSAVLLPGVDLSFDAIRYTGVPVVVLDLRAPSVLLGYQLGGIIGHRFLSQYQVAIDLDRSVLRLKKNPQRS